jgi:hypothetical protein
MLPGNALWGIGPLAETEVATVKIVVRAFLAAFAITALMVIAAIAWRTSWPVVDVMLHPGYVFPKEYWGGIGDPLQGILAIALNIIFYTVAFCCVFWLWGRWRKGHDA